MRRSNGKKGLQLLQQEKGYRSALDPFLLADFVRLGKGDRAIDLGTGNGIIPILLAARQGEAQLVGLEIQPELIDLARQNITLNDLTRERRIQIVEGDIREVSSLFSRGSYDVVVGNPPFRKLGDGRLNPDPSKAIARHELTLTLGELVAGAEYLLKDKGRFAIIYHPGRLVELLAQMEKLGIRPHRLRLVHSTSQSPAKMVLLDGIKSGRCPLEVMPPLLIYNQPHEYSPELERIFSVMSGFSLPSRRGRIDISSRGED